MKITPWAIVGLLMVAGLAVWQSSRHELPSPKKPLPGPGLESVAGSAATSAETREQHASAHPFPAALLTETAAKLSEFNRLRAQPDDIENFRKSAEIENEFINTLSPSKAAFLIQQMPAGFTDSYFGALCLHKWATAERLDAAQWMKTHPSDSPTTARALAEGWLAADLTSLYSYLDQLPPGPWHNNLAASASEDAFLAREPSIVIALLDQISGPSQRRDQLYEWNATAWAMKDHAAAVHWVETNAAPEQRQALLAATATGYAHSNPPAAANWAIAHVSDLAALKPAMQAIVRIWAAQDQPAALQWVESLPSGPLKDESADGLIAIALPE